MQRTKSEAFLKIYRLVNTKYSILKRETILSLYLPKRPFSPSFTIYKFEFNFADTIKFIFGFTTSKFMTAHFHVEKIRVEYIYLILMYEINQLSIVSTLVVLFSMYV